MRVLTSLSVLLMAGEAHAGLSRRKGESGSIPLAGLLKAGTLQRRDFECHSGLGFRRKP